MISLPIYRICWRWFKFYPADSWYCCWFQFIRAYLLCWVEWRSRGGERRENRDVCYLWIL